MTPAGPGSLTEAFYADPVRHYMLPVFSDRRTDWPSHPHATRDSLHEHDMWVAEGLTHRYPTKVLAELLPTCPQYCGHCTRMDLVGNSTAVIDKLKFAGKPNDRLGDMIDYLRRTPSVRDVVVSGGDVANMPWPRLEAFLMSAARDRQHPRHPARDQGPHRPAAALAAARRGRGRRPRRRGRPLARRLAGDAHPRQPRELDHADRRRGARGRCSTPACATYATRACCSTASTPTRTRCSTCASALLDGAQIMPYYFYMCDMIPFSEHWRVSVADAQRLQHHIMGYLPGFATPRIVCDVPFVGKRWVHQLADYDTERGISYWTKNYRTSIEADDAEALSRDLRVLRPDPHPPRVRPAVVGRARPTSTRLALKAAEMAEASRRTAALQAW